MDIYPAIDLRVGKVVRLRQGDPARQTVFFADPSEAASHWQAEGAERLHVVNLDGAFADASSRRNADAIRAILRACALPIQLGGGLRSLAAIRAALELGVARVVIGTLAVESPDTVGEAVRAFGAGRVAAGLDAKDGMVATHGWQAPTALTVLDAALRLKAVGVERIIFTDIGRDGMLQGVNVAATRALARESGLRVIASGGVAALEDIERLMAAAVDGIEGVIIGQALYTGAINLREALHVGQTNHPLPGR